MAEELLSGRKDRSTFTPLIADLERDAEQARIKLNKGEIQSLEQLVSALEKLLAVKDFNVLPPVFAQLPESAGNQPPIISAFLRFLFLSGDRQRARNLASKIKQDDPEIVPAELELLIERLSKPSPPLKSLEPPLLKDYAFDLHDSHYSMKMLLHCPACGLSYIETTGWGIMILRATYCSHCLEPRLIHPDFLGDVLRHYHDSDGREGFRKVDEELFKLVTTWHLQGDYPSEGRLGELNLADPLMLPILRMLIRGMYLERYVKEEEPVC